VTHGTLNGNKSNAILMRQRQSSPARFHDRARQGGALPVRLPCGEGK
jgi:hypothetical protein